MAEVLFELGLDLGKKINLVDLALSLNVASVSFPAGFQDRYQSLIRDGQIPLVVSGHQSHADPVAEAQVMRQLMNWSGQRLGGFIVGVARSVETGHQGDQLQFIHEVFREQLARDHIYLKPITRGVDRIRFGIGDRNDEYDLSLESAGFRGEGVLTYPAATVVVGDMKRAGKPGWEKAHQEAWRRNNSPVARTFEKMTGVGVERVFLIAMGIEGTYRIFSRRFTLNSALLMVNPYDKPIRMRLELPVAFEDIPGKGQIRTLGQFHPMDRLMVEQVSYAQRALRS